MKNNQSHLGPEEQKILKRLNEILNDKEAKDLIEKPKSYLIQETLSVLNSIIDERKDYHFTYFLNILKPGPYGFLSQIYNINHEELNQNIREILYNTEWRSSTIIVKIEKDKLIFNLRLK